MRFRKIVAHCTLRSRAMAGLGQRRSVDGLGVALDGQAAALLL